MSDPEIIDSDDELLVAYLDGELPREDRDAVENRLIAEEPLRQRMQELQRSWDMLDWLPNPVTNETSVQTTLQLVVADLNQPSDSSTKSGPWDSTQRKRIGGRRSKYWLLLALPILIAAAAFGLTRLRQLREIRSQLIDFPVAIDMDAYAAGSDLELITDLMASPRWRGVVGGSVTPQIDAIIDPKSPESLYPASNEKIALPDRQTLLAKLEDVPSQQRIIALSRWERFNRLDEEAKQALRQTAALVRSSDKPTEMLNTMRQYVRLRELISDDVVARIETGSGVVRQQAIDDAIEETITSIGRVTGRSLSEEAIERIDFTVIQLAKERIKGQDQDDERPAAAALFQFIEQRGRRGGDPNDAYRMFALGTLLRDANWARGPGRSFRGAPGFERVAPLTQRELLTIQSMLPNKDLEMLQQYVSDPWMQSLVLRDWAAEALRRKLRGEAKAPSFAEQYESLPPNQREALDLASPDEVRKVLIEGF
ncbi:anti-sigma factor family protein [Aporhodopirellula aestuarii]|uniref:Zf-HC2 domain-containing protein n=1 Tax=Aporhodopirellula aestuarii TaxID=2950107 RepID=A0ABT0U9J6_9BACT|nr:zf-HC2 domain-containing protein [Aporhodopirellula aestuarii]MCM2373546.1 zf-HC2 domain-containing protein [Aporhodopirellula aestuarii]